MRAIGPRFLVHWPPTAPTVVGLGTTAILTSALLSVAQRDGVPLRSVFAEGSAITLYVCTLLVLASLSALLTVFAIRFRADHRQGGDHDAAGTRLLWLFIAGTLAFLAADERFMLHESLDDRVHAALGLTAAGWTDHLDDAIVASYGLALLAVLAAVRKQLRRYLPSLRLALAIVVLGCGAVLCEVLGNGDGILGLAIGDPRLIRHAHTLLAVAEETAELFTATLILLVLGRCLLVEAAPLEAWLPRTAHARQGV